MTHTETTVRTNVRREDRFGGYQTTDTRSHTMFEPEFKPFTFGNQEIVANHETEIVASEPAFEVEKQYTFDTTSYERKEQEMSIPTLEKRKEETAYQPKVKAKLNARGKIVVAVYSIVVAIIVAFCIYNGVMISGLNSDVDYKNGIVATQTQVITDLQNTYNSLGEDDAIISQVGDSFKVPTSADTVALSDFTIAEREVKQEQTNWFERFCETIKKLFS